MPSVAKVKVVPPRMVKGWREWWVSTNTGPWYGGSSPHQPVQFGSHSPRIGPNMLRPMTKAPAERISSSSALFSSGVSNIQACRRSTGPSPKGFSRVWLGPATYPSAETEISHTTLLMRSSAYQCQRVLRFSARHFYRHLKLLANCLVLRGSG